MSANDIAFSVVIKNDGISDIIFKTIMLKGDKGNSVSRVEKTSTSGLVDTYTIYLTDGTIGGTFTVTNGNDINIDDTAVSYSKTWSSQKIKSELDDLSSDLSDAVDALSGMIPQTATIEDVAIASFSDGADDLPVSELIVDIEAVQEGSGEPSPENERRIIGWSECNLTRAGKNLLENDYTKWKAVGSYLKYTSISPENVPLIASFEDNDTSIDVSGCYLGFVATEYSDGGATDYHWLLNNGSLVADMRNYSTRDVNILCNSLIIYPNNETTYNKIFSRYKIQIQVGSTATAYEAYNGDTAKIAWAVNQWDEDWELGVYNTTTGLPEGSLYSIRGKNRFAVYPNTQYYANNNFVRRLYYDVDDNFISADVGIGAKTTPANCRYMRIYMADAYGTTYNNDISINYPATETSYHAYTGIGMIFGGYLNFTTGEMTILKAGVDLGSLNYTKYDVTQGSLFRSDELPIKKTTAQYDVPNILCETYKTVANANRENLTISMVNNTARVDIIDNNYSDASTFKTAVAGKKLIYELAEPIEIQLSGVEVMTLLKNNNIYADTGNINKLVYFKAGSEAVARLIEAYMRGNSEPEE